MNVKRAVWRQYLKLKFLLFQRHRHDRLVLEQVAGKPLIVLPQVFNPTLFLTSEFMVQCFNETLIPPGSQVLDMGTGSGVGAIFASQWASHVTAVDINPMAVRCARINVLLNELERRIDVCQSDLFESVGGRQFDVVLFNPPYFRGKPASMLERAYRADDVLARFAHQLPDFLRPAGTALLLLSSEATVAEILKGFEDKGFAYQLAAQRNMVSETVYLYQLNMAQP